MKNRNNGKFLVWFADKVYLLRQVFDLNESFEEKLPSIVSMVHEIRNASPKVSSIYCGVKGICGCLEELDRALYAAEKLALCGYIDKSRKEECKFQLERSAVELARIWSEEYGNCEERQAALASYA